MTRGPRQRLLLFDSACGQCRALARTVERAADGRLVARSLREPAVQALLGAARPGWRWQPTLLELTGDHPRAYTGLGMAARIVTRLGPRRAWRLVRTVSRLSQPAAGLGAGRRRFLRAAGGGVALALAGPGLLQIPGRRTASAQAQDNSVTTTTFVGTVADTGASIGIVVGQRASAGQIALLAFVCDGVRQADWLRPDSYPPLSIGDQPFRLTAPSGATLTVDLQGPMPTGTIADANGNVHELNVEPVSTPAGIWEDSGTGFGDMSGNPYSAAWILKPDGSQVGAVVALGAHGPITGQGLYTAAPPLDPSNPTLTVILPPGAYPAGRPDSISPPVALTRQWRFDPAGNPIVTARTVTCGPCPGQFHDSCVGCS